MLTLLLALACSTKPAEPVAPKAAPPPAPVSALPAGANPALLDPKLATETAPDSYRVKFDTTKGEFVVKVTRAWAPNGADRFYNLVKIGYYNDIAFFRVVDGFMVQFGIHGIGDVNKVWRNARIQDDPATHHNTRGQVTFATAGPNTRTTQVFINFGDNSNLDSQGFAPFGEVEGNGMEVVDSLYKGYGEGYPHGGGPDQGRLQMKGNSYLKESFPEMDYVKTASLLP